MTKKERKDLELIEDAIKKFPKIIADKKRAYQAKEKILKRFKTNSKKFKDIIDSESETQKTHPWRFCVPGRHWVRDHDLHIKPSQNHPDGKTIRHGHCADNPSHKDSLYAGEIHDIAEKYFSNLRGPPKLDSLGYDHGNDYDEFIRGWTKYWNDIFQPKDPLDPNLVKALIATESGFDKNIKVRAGKGIGYARGLMQVTDQTQKILEDIRGELKDHLVHVSQNEMTNPNMNIAAGIRWLFRKKEIADSRGKALPWIDAISKYKKLPKDSDVMQRLKRLYDRLRKK